ncbi:MAG: sigma-70 family RNA polymerase sigma factor [Planctomycetes bacterium]|nr:sigma-70 family RNA polymerase sigma factor [Planctomycetota bacterium]
MADFSPDEQLISAYRGGDDEAATELFERYYGRLIELIRRQMGWRLKQVEGSVDVAQSVLRSFFKQLRDKQVTVGPDDDLWPLLVTVALNKIRNRGKFWSRQRRDPRRQSPLVEGLDPLEREPSPDDAAVVQDLIEQLLAPFSGRRRQIIELILQGEPVKSIAEQVGTTERTIYNTRMAAASTLEKLLATEPPEEE